MSDPFSIALLSHMADLREKSHGQFKQRLGPNEGHPWPKCNLYA